MMHQKYMCGAALVMTAALAGPLPAADPAAPASAAPASAAPASAAPASAGAGFELFTESEAAEWNTTRPKESTDFKVRDLRDDNAAPTSRSTPNNDANT